IRFLTDWVSKKSYHPFRTSTMDRDASGALYTQAQFETAAAQLAAEVPRLSDIQIEMRLTRLVAGLGDGHTAVWGSEARDFTLTLPLGFYLFDEGLYVISAAPKYKDLAGARVVALDDQPVTEALGKLDPLIGRDNTMWLKTMEPYYLRRTAFLKE